MRVAILHDWLSGMRGGEHVLEVFCAMFPEAEIFSLFGNDDCVSDSIARHRIHYGMLNKLPLILKTYRYFLPLYPAAARELGGRISREHSKRPFDLIVSISHCAVKNVPIPADVPHICYCLTPMRYIWDQYDAYFSGHRLEPVIRKVARQLRRWDLEASSRPTELVAISDYVAERIFRYYRRKATVVYPPVATDWLAPAPNGSKGDGFLCVSALVPYKNVDKIIAAFNRLGLPLVVVGTGPEEKRLKRMANENVMFRGKVSDSGLAELYRTSKALVFAAEEDFGMVPVEMQASGRPVIAYGRGGARETVCLDASGPTGVLFADLEPQTICHAVQFFMDHQGDFAVENCLKHAEKFSVRRFSEGISSVLSHQVAADVPERAAAYRRTR